MCGESFTAWVEMLWSHNYSTKILRRCISEWLKNYGSRGSIRSTGLLVYRPGDGFSDSTSQFLSTFRFSPTPKRSIVYSLEGAAAQADFQLLVSIYNPNVLDAKIESGTAVLYHKHIEVMYCLQYR